MSEAARFGNEFLEASASSSPAAAVLRLIDKSVNSTEGCVDPRLLKAIKSAARDSEDELRLAAQVLMDHMKKQHSQVRFLAIHIIDELFMRSKLFRTLLVVNMDQFLSLSIGFRNNMPLPPPSTIASKLRSKSIELLEKWNASFGVHYRQLRLGFKYLKDVLKYQFPNRLETADRLHQERREREIRTKEILLIKFEKLKENCLSIKNEVQSTIDQIWECLSIIQGTDNDFTIFSEGNVPEEFVSPTLQQIRLASLKEGEKVQEGIDNKPVFDALRELLKLLVSKHLPAVQDWMSILVRVDSTDNKFRDMLLKESIDIRNHIQSVIKKCTQVGCSLDNICEEDDDFWEEGKIETNVSAISTVLDSSMEGPLEIQKGNKGKDLIPDQRTLAENSLKPISDSRAKLLSVAPVVTWGPSLDTWGSCGDVLANQRGLELEGHWGRVDYDAVIPAEKIAELSVHRTLYKEQAVEIQPCRAPMKSGGLCQRRDLRICPFHGPIVARDEEGRPIETDTYEQGPAKQTSGPEIIPGNGSQDQEKNIDSQEFVKILAKQAVKNVRERERDTKALKRAKLARVREHNESVLREAALASTSFSETLTNSTDEIHNHGARVAKKPTLASMLRKKITVKDRLAHRLLNTYAADALTRQMMQGEDLAYREAFPNQW